MQPATCNISIHRRRRRGSASTGVGGQRPRSRGASPCGRPISPMLVPTQRRCGCLSPHARSAVRGRTLSAGPVHATPTTPISPTSLCPSNLFGSTPALSVPALGTENDDHNFRRALNRATFRRRSGAIIFSQGDKYRWSARLHCHQCDEPEALYNFISTFSGTHYISPRAMDVGTVGFHF